MSDKNKSIIKATLSNIINDGYTICHNCYAGLKNKSIINIFTNDNLDIYVSELNLPTKEEYLNELSNVGEWYVKNIPTYQRKLQEEALIDYNGTDKYIKNIWLMENALFSISIPKKFNIIMSDNDGNLFDKYNNSSNILKANEIAVNSYKNNFSDINFELHLAYYPCELIIDSSNYNMAGDDCVRFIFTCLNAAYSDFVYYIEKYSGYDWRSIDTYLLCGNDIKIAKQCLNVALKFMKQI